MTVPQSLLVVALALAWIVLLVPSLTRRRGHVKETVEGSGFRVLSRPPAAARRPVRRTANPPVAAAQDIRRTARSEDQMTSHQVDVDRTDDGRADDDTVVMDTVVMDTVEMDTVAGTVEAHGSHPYGSRPDDGDRDGAADAADNTDAVTSEGFAHEGFADDGFAHDEVAFDEEAQREEAAAYDEQDEAELRRQYQAWRASTRDESVEDGGNVGPDAEATPEPSNVRPIPRRPGRGTYDPEAAERARAYKFARRRRAVLVLTLLIVGFAIAAVLVSSSLWIGAAVSVVLLALFLAYLRRQVTIEADIRHRRLAKLERARQIRPEHAQGADEMGDPYAQRTSGPIPATGPVRHRSNRVVLDLDDDDPGFDDLEQYEPMEYRRAVGQ